MLSEKMEESAFKLDKLSWFFLAFIIAVCAWRFIILYYWWFLPEIELPSSPAIYKSVNYPWVSIWFLIITLPCVLVLVLPAFRDALRVAFVSGVLVSLGIASIVGMWFLSANVSGPATVFVLAGMHFYKLSRVAE
ncbi:MAG: hypothetical protein JBO36_12235 [Candidatus Thiodiazotropha taylori]|nr:hypothetical protein [Candidatus Thiodiazotropha taylori]